MAKAKSPQRRRHLDRSLDGYAGELLEFLAWCNQRDVNFRKSVMFALALYRDQVEKMPSHDVNITLYPNG